MSEITQKFEDGTYTQDELLDWHDSYGENMMYQNSLKNLSEDQFENIYTHQDEDYDYKIGEVNQVPVIYEKNIRPKIFGANLDDLQEKGEKVKSQLQAAPGFLADMLNPKNIAKGMNQGVVNAFGLVDSLTGGSVTKLDNYFTENFPNTLGKKIEYEKPDTAGGTVGSVIGQYVVPGIGLLKLLRGSVLLSEPLLVGAFSSKDEGNMANLFKDLFPDFTKNNEAANIIVNGLISNEDDSEVIGRLKNIAADSPIAFAFEGIFKIYKSLYKNEEAIQEIRSAGAAATPKEAPTTPVVTQGDTGFVKLNISDDDLAISNYDRVRFDEGSERPFKVFLKGQDNHLSSFKTQQEAEDFINDDIVNYKRIEENNARVLSKSEKPFYSNVEKTISNFTFKKQPGNQILATLNNTAGIKQSEIQDLGLDTFLKDNPSVTKEQLDDFIADKSLTTRVKEIVLEGTEDIGGDVGDMNFAVGFENTRPDELTNANSFDDAKLIVKNNQELYDELTEFFIDDDISEMEMLEDDFIETFLEEQYGITKTFPESSPTKFKDETLPGGEDYKEILITAPGTPQVYTKHHFNKDVPPGENLIAHARFNTRVIDGKKTLFIEEIQSDLHQAGRKEGYKEPITEEMEIAYERAIPLNKQEIAKLDNEMRKLTGERTPELIQKEQEILKEIEFLEKNIESMENSLKSGYTSGNIADAPFKKNWHELTMKRLIKYAVDNGFEAISFTPGKVQNARYNLSQVVSKIQVTPSLHATNKIALYTYDKNDLLSIYNIPKENLENYVGKELSQKILKDIEGNDLFKNFDLEEYKKSPQVDSSEQEFVDQGLSYKDTDLEIGGKGMKGFYDDMLTKFLNKFGKKYKAELETKNINQKYSESSYKYENDDFNYNKNYDAIGKNGTVFASYKLITEVEPYKSGGQLVTKLIQFKNGKETIIESSPFANKVLSVLADELEGFKVPQIKNKKDIIEVPYMVITPDMKKEILTEGVPIAQVEEQEEKNTALV